MMVASVAGNANKMRISVLILVRDGLECSTWQRFLDQLVLPAGTASSSGDWGDINKAADAASGEKAIGKCWHT